MGGCLSYRLKLVNECDELPKSVTLFRKVTRFSFKSLEKATSNFNSDGNIRNDGYSKSYMGILDDGSQVEVVVFSSSSTERIPIEFTSIISIMSGLKHKNVVELIGYCCEGDHRILVHKFVGVNSLDQLLLPDAGISGVLDWPTRVSICRDIARGLDHLHNAINPRVVHRDIKPSNIIMDTSFNPKITGFKVSCLLEEGESHHSGYIVGTFGHLDPEVVRTGRFSEKSDIYAFGITLLQIITGYAIFSSFLRDHRETSLPDWAWELLESGRISEIIDEKLSDFSEDEVKRLISVALSCVQQHSNLRPSMSEVRLMLSDSYDYSKLVLTAPFLPVTQQEQMISSDSKHSEVSVNLVNNEDTFFENVTRLSFQSLKMATNDFNPSSEIRHNGFSRAYKGILDDGIEVVVKVYNTEEMDIDFSSMIRIMSGVAHKNVVRLIGICIEYNHKMLVHEFVGDCSLDQLLFLSSRVEHVVLDWPKRVSICHGIACALDYLHNEFSPCVVLRDVKTSNILIDDNFNAKIADFEVSCLLDGGESDQSDETYGCLDPEYRTTGRYSAKTDVYAFGIAVLEIINGSKVWLFWQGHGQKSSLVDRALELRASGKIAEIVDPTLSEFSEAEVICLVNAALACVQSTPHLRPSMSEVRQMLSGVC